MGDTRRVKTILAGLVAVLLLGACQADWSTVGFDLQRTGDNPLETTLTPATVAGLQEEWAAPVGSYVNTSPVVASDILPDGTIKTYAYVGDEAGDFEAVDTATGAVVWHHQLGSHLGGPNNPGCAQSPFGVTSTPVIDPTTGRIYVVDGDDELSAFDLASGAPVPGWPLALSTDPGSEHVWSGLTLSGGVLYVAVASDCDNPPYRGRLVAVDTSTVQVTGTFDVEDPAGPDGGGIWGWGGASVNPAGTDLYVAPGNALGPDSNAGYADHVVELSATDLSVVGSDLPSIPQGDQDLSGTPVLFQGTGCPAELAVEAKDGSLFLYQQDDLGAGPLQTLQLADPTPDDFIGDPAWDGSTGTLYVSNSSASVGFPNGMLAFGLDAGCRLTPRWQAQLGPAASVVSPPIVAAGVVYYADGAGDTVYALDGATGSVLWSHQLPGPVFTRLTVTNGVLYASCWDGNLYAFSLPPTGG